MVLTNLLKDNFIECLQDSFQKTMESFGGSCGSYSGKNYVNKVQEEVEKTVQKIIEIGKTGKNIHLTLLII